jgi:CheY-like chemotaxis protein
MSQTLLLADDSVTIQRVIELTFADEDIRVIAVGDGQQAIDRIKADPPDIVLADTGMPEHDGYEVATFIRDDPALAHIPVLLLTGAFEPVDGDRAREAGCAGVLVKPFEPQVVISRVRDLLGGRQAAAPTALAPVRVPGPGLVEVAPRPREQAETPASTPLQTAVEPDLDLGSDLDLGPDPGRDKDATLSWPAPDRVASDPGEVRPASAGGIDPDDPLGAYLDRMDEAFDRLEGGEPVRPDRRAGGDEPARAGAPAEPGMDSLEGALSALEGALGNLTLDDLAADTDETDAAPDWESEGAHADQGADTASWAASRPAARDVGPVPVESLPVTPAPTVTPPLVAAPPPVAALPPAAEPSPPAPTPAGRPRLAAPVVIDPKWLTEAPPPATPPVAEASVAPVSEPVPPVTASAPTPAPTMMAPAPPPEPVETSRTGESAPPSSVTSLPEPAPQPPPVEPTPSVDAPAATVEPSLEPSREPVFEPALPSSSPRSSPPVPRRAPAAPPSLADAFASLLAAEQGQADRARTVYPWPRPGSSPAADEELIARVTERVIDRLSDSVTAELVAQVVAQVTERLVREELGRKK